MGSGDEEVKLEQRIKLLEQQILEASQQRRQTLNQSDYPVLDEQIESFKQQRREADSELQRLRSGDAASHTLNELNILKAKLWKELQHELIWLDFDEAENDLHNIIRVQRQNAVLLLLKQGVQKKADLFMRRIHDRVLDSSRIKPYCEPIMDCGPVDAFAFVEKWRSSLGLGAFDNDLNATVNGIVTTLHGSVRSGQILYLRMELDAVAEGFFGWFIENFWKVLIGDPAMASKKTTIVVALALNNSERLASHLPNLCCKRHDFSADKYLQINLKNWSEADITRWLDDYLMPSLERSGISCSKSTQAMAKRIHGNSKKGTPLHAHNFILTDILNEIFHPLGVS